MKLVLRADDGKPVASWQLPPSASRINPTMLGMAVRAEVAAHERRKGPGYEAKRTPRAKEQEEG